MSVAFNERHTPYVAPQTAGAVGSVFSYTKPLKGSSRENVNSLQYSSNHTFFKVTGNTAVTSESCRYRSKHKKHSRYRQVTSTSLTRGKPLGYDVPLYKTFVPGSRESGDKCSVSSREGKFGRSLLSDDVNGFPHKSVDSFQYSRHQSSSSATINADTPGPPHHPSAVHPNIQLLSYSSHTTGTSATTGSHKMGFDLPVSEKISQSTNGIPGNIKASYTSSSRSDKEPRCLAKLPKTQVDKSAYRHKKDLNVSPEESIRSLKNLADRSSFKSTANLDVISEQSRHQQAALAKHQRPSCYRQMTGTSVRDGNPRWSNVPLYKTFLPEKRVSGETLEDTTNAKPFIMIDRLERKVDGLVCVDEVNSSTEKCVSTLRGSFVQYSSSSTNDAKLNCSSSENGSKTQVAKPTYRDDLDLNGCPKRSINSLQHSVDKSSLKSTANLGVTSEQSGHQSAALSKHQLPSCYGQMTGTSLKRGNSVGSDASLCERFIPERVDGETLRAATTTKPPDTKERSEREADGAVLVDELNSSSEKNFNTLEYSLTQYSSSVTVNSVDTQRSSTNQSAALSKDHRLSNSSHKTGTSVTTGGYKTGFDMPLRGSIAPPRVDCGNINSSHPASDRSERKADGSLFAEEVNSSSEKNVNALQNSLTQYSSSVTANTADTRTPSTNQSADLSKDQQPNSTSYKTSTSGSYETGLYTPITVSLSLPNGVSGNTRQDTRQHKTTSGHNSEKLCCSGSEKKPKTQDCGKRKPSAFTDNVNKSPDNSIDGLLSTVSQYFQSATVNTAETWKPSPQSDALSKDQQLGYSSLALAMTGGYKMGFCTPVSESKFPSKSEVSVKMREASTTTSDPRDEQRHCSSSASCLKTEASVDGSSYHEDKVSKGFPEKRTNSPQKSSDNSTLKASSHLLVTPGPFWYQSATLAKPSRYGHVIRTSVTRRNLPGADRPLYKRCLPESSVSGESHPTTTKSKRLKLDNTRINVGRSIFSDDDDVDVNISQGKCVDNHHFSVNQSSYSAARNIANPEPSAALLKIYQLSCSNTTSTKAIAGGYLLSKGSTPSTCKLVDSIKTSHTPSHPNDRKLLCSGSNNHLEIQDASDATDSAIDAASGKAVADATADSAYVDDSPTNAASTEVTTTDIFRTTRPTGATNNSLHQCVDNNLLQLVNLSSTTTIATTETVNTPTSSSHQSSALLKCQQFSHSNQTTGTSALPGNSSFTSQVPANMESPSTGVEGKTESSAVPTKLKTHTVPEEAKISVLPGHLSTSRVLGSAKSSLLSGSAKTNGAPRNTQVSGTLGITKKSGLPDHGVSELLGHGKSGLPGHGASGLPGHGTSGVLGHGRSRMPGHGGSGLPGHGASELPGHSASGLPGHGTSRVPGHGTSGAQSHGTSGAPSRGTSVSPGHRTSGAPGHGTSRAPGHGTSGAPGHGTSGAPGHGTSGVLGHRTSWAPGHGTSRAPGHETSGAPGHTASEAPSRGTSGAPSRGTSGAPGHGTSGAPGNRTSGALGHGTSGALGHGTSGAPGHGTSGAPGHWTSGAPGHRTSGVQGHRTSGAPGHGTSGAPGHGASGLPDHGASGVPSHGTSGAPGHGTSGAPGHGTSRAPGHGTSGAPGHGTSGAPSHGTSGAPGHGTSGAPGHGTSRAPGHGTSGAQGHGTSGAPGHGTSGAPGYRASGAPGHRTSGAPGHGTSGAPGHTACEAPSRGTSGAPGHGTSWAPGHGTSGAPGHGTSGAPGYRTSGAPGHGTSGAPGHGASGLPSHGASGVPDRGTSGVPDRGTSGVPDRGTSGAPGHGTSGAPGRGTSGAPGRGTSGAPGRGTSGAPGRGTSGAPGRGTSGALDHGTSEAPSLGTSRVPDLGTSGAPGHGASGLPPGHGTSVSPGHGTSVSPGHGTSVAPAEARPSGASKKITSKKMASKTLSDTKTKILNYIRIHYLQLNDNSSNSLQYSLGYSSSSGNTSGPSGSGHTSGTSSTTRGRPVVFHVPLGASSHPSTCEVRGNAKKYSCTPSKSKHKNLTFIRKESHKTNDNTTASGSMNENCEDDERLNYSCHYSCSAAGTQITITRRQADVPTDLDRGLCVLPTKNPQSGSVVSGSSSTTSNPTDKTHPHSTEIEPLKIQNPSCLDNSIECIPDLKDPQHSLRDGSSLPGSEIERIPSVAFNQDPPYQNTCQNSTKFLSSVSKNATPQSSQTREECNSSALSFETWSPSTSNLVSHAPNLNTSSSTPVYGTLQNTDNCVLPYTVSFPSISAMSTSGTYVTFMCDQQMPQATQNESNAGNQGNKYNFFSEETERTCQICNLVVASQGHLARHMMAHGANYKHRCHICDCSFSRVKRLRSHVERAHMRIE
nr:mucin-4-like [Cherax quadricarinatus]